MVEVQMLAAGRWPACTKMVKPKGTLKEALTASVTPCNTRFCA